MARSRRGGGFGGGAARRRPAPARRPASTQSKSSEQKTTPAPMQSQPPATQGGGGGGMLSGIGSTIAQGMAFGTGSAVAHRAVGAAAGAMSGGDGQQGDYQMDSLDQQQLAEPAQQVVQGACANDKQMFYECLQVNKGDQEACAFLYEQLKQCQQSESTMSFN